MSDFWILAGSLTLMAIAVLKAFRYVIRKCGAESWAKDGVVLLKDWLEFSRFPMPGSVKVKYSEIESLEVVPLPKLIFSLALFRYGTSVVNRSTRLSLEFVVLGIVSPTAPQYLILTPKDASAFVERVRSEIEHNRRSVAPT